MSTWLEYADRKIDVFAAAMKQEMRANAHKGFWRGKTVDHLNNEAYYHMAKLSIALHRRGLLGDPCTCTTTVKENLDGYIEVQSKDGKHNPAKCAGNDPILEFAADVANLMMMITEREQLLGLTDLAPEEFDFG